MCCITDRPGKVGNSFPCRSLIWNPWYLHTFNLTFCSGGYKWQADHSGNSVETVIITMKKKCHSEGIEF